MTRPVPPLDPTASSDELFTEFDRLVTDEVTATALLVRGCRVCGAVIFAGGVRQHAQWHRDVVTERPS